MTKDEVHLKRLNDYLEDYFPHFRIVWNADQFEHRFGTFIKHEPIYSRVTEIRKVPKYNWLTPHCYILETKAVAMIPEIKDHNGWDIAFPFIDMNGDAAFPDMESVQFMMNELVNHNKKRTLKDEKAAEEAEQKSFDNEVKEIEERLSE
jgi:hypothetical protein